MMQWRVYGCGSASSNLYHQTSYECSDGDTRLHIDMGNGAIYQRCRSEGGINAALDSIEHLFISHGHPDHTIDLTRHIVAWKYSPGYSPGKPVHLYATGPTHVCIRRLFDATGFGYLMDEVYVPVEVHPGETLSIGSLKVTPVPTQHMEGSIGLRIQNADGISVGFTGDTTQFPELDSHHQGLELLVAEASFFEYDHPMHLTLGQVAELAGNTNPNTVLTVHAYPEMEEKGLQELQAAFAQSCSCQLIPANDGLSLTWNPTSASWDSGCIFPNS